MSWGEAPLADEALALARERLAEKDMLSGRFALAQTYWSGGRTKEAMKLYDEIFAELQAKKIPPSAGLLASAARLAQQSGDLARAIELRNPYVDPMSLLQINLLREWRAGDRSDEALLKGLFATVNGIAQGIQNTG